MLKYTEDEMSSIKVIKYLSTQYIFGDKVPFSCCLSDD